MLVPFCFLKAFRNILRIGVVSVADIAWKPLVRRNPLMTAIDFNHAVGNFQVHLLANKTVGNGILVCQVGNMKISADDATVFPYSPEADAA